MLCKSIGKRDKKIRFVFYVKLWDTRVAQMDIDPNMGSPQAKISQAKTNRGGYMAEQPTNWMFTNLPIALADFCIKAK